MQVQHLLLNPLNPIEQSRLRPCFAHQPQLGIQKPPLAHPPLYLKYHGSFTMKMYFSPAACMCLLVALTGTSHGHVVETRNEIFSPKDYAFKEMDDGALQITPLNGKRQIIFCSFWEAFVVCELGLSDTNICQSYYCSCSGYDIDCQPGTTCLNTCDCFVACSTLA